MKNKFLSFRTFAILAFVGVSVVMTSCKKDDPIEETLEDGYYIKGAGTAYTDAVLMDAGINEAVQVAKAGLFEMYLPVKAGTDGFNLVVVEGGVEKTFGPETSADVVIAGEDWQINETIKQGTAGEGKGNFTVAEDGMYHFVYDKTTNIYMLIPASVWEVNGQQGQMTMSAFNKDAMTWTFENANLPAGKTFKFRHSLGWKVVIDETEAGSADNIFNINTNFGGVVSGDTIAGVTSTLVPGGGDFAIGAAQAAQFKIELKWTKANGFAAVYTKTGSAIVSAQSWGVIGNAVPTTGWDSDVDMTFKGNGVWEITLDLLVGEIKFREGNGWDTNYGGTDGVLSPGGANIAIAAAGNYTIVMNTTALTYTITKN